MRVDALSLSFKLTSAQAGERACAHTHSLLEPTPLTRRVPLFFLFLCSGYSPRLEGLEHPVVLTRTRSKKQEGARVLAALVDSLCFVNMLWADLACAK